MRTLIILLAAMLILNSACSSQKKAPEFTKPLKVLVFSKTMGFRHASISAGLKMLYDQSKAENWVITATEDASLFSDDFLSDFDLAVFLSPTGDILNNDEQAAFERFIKSGKGFVGIHAAADCEYNWPFYGNLVGAYFMAHPPAQEATIIFENFDNPAMKPFKGMKTYTTTDEWYAYKKNPRKKVHVLARLDETSIKKSNNDKWKMDDHPIIWWNEKEGARSFYTVFGHTNEAFQDKKVIEHITNAINWVGHRIN